MLSMQKKLVNSRIKFNILLSTSILSCRFSASDVKNLKIYLGAHNIKTGPRSERRVRRIIRRKDFNPRTKAMALPF